MKIKLILLSLVLAVLAFWGFSFTDTTPEDEKILLTLTAKVVNDNHYGRMSLDDKLSERIFDLYLQRIDFHKMYFLKKDIKGFESYRHRLDDDIIKGDLSFYREVSKLFDKRFAEVEIMVKELLADEMEFNENEKFQTDPEKRDYCETDKELRQVWRKYLKYTVLNSYLGKLENQEKAIEKGVDSTGSTFTVKSNEELLKESLDAVRKSMDTRFKRRAEVDDEDNFSAFVNALTSAYDPHTQYFPPQEKENFDMRMTGRLEGIGALLEESDGFVKINSIVTGSACWKQGELEVGDIILKVAQGEGEPEDIVNAQMKEVLKLIRGPRGTEVRLTVQKKDGRITIIPIIRDVVIREETYAKSAVITDNKSGKKFGYLFLPGFYSKFGQKEGRSSADDVDNELEKLKKEGVAGVVLDLRNNGGGSLPDAVEMAGLFVKDGPIVQVRSAGEKPYVKADFNSSVTYGGPLVIMTNSFSASASEILSAALQDYGRAYIVGSSATYGKGTVQTFLDLNRFITPGVETSVPFGSIKITVQQFYRVNGSSTQFKGVVPHVVLPDMYDVEEVGERSLDYSTPWDSVSPLSFSHWAYPQTDLALVRDKSRKRLEESEYFKMLDKSVKVMKEDEVNSELSLLYSEVKNRRESRKKLNDELEASRKVNTGIGIRSLQEITIQGDTVTKALISDWEKVISKDA